MGYGSDLLRLLEFRAVFVAMTYCVTMWHIRKLCAHSEFRTNFKLAAKPSDFRRSICSWHFASEPEQRTRNEIQRHQKPSIYIHPILMNTSPAIQPKSDGPKLQTQEPSTVNPSDLALERPANFFSTASRSLRAFSASWCVHAAIQTSGKVKQKLLCAAVSVASSDFLVV